MPRKRSDSPKLSARRKQILKSEVVFNPVKLSLRIRKSDVKVTKQGAVMLAGILDYLCQEVLVNSGNYVAYQDSF